MWNEELYELVYILQLSKLKIIKPIPRSSGTLRGLFCIQAKLIEIPIFLQFSLCSVNGYCLKLVLEENLFVHMKEKPRLRIRGFLQDILNVVI